MPMLLIPGRPMVAAIPAGMRRRRGIPVAARAVVHRSDRSELPASAFVTGAGWLVVVLWGSLVAAAGRAGVSSTVLVTVTVGLAVTVASSVTAGSASPSSPTTCVVVVVTTACSVTVFVAVA